MEQVIYSTSEATVFDDLGVKIVLENFRSYTSGKGDPKSPDFIEPKFEDRLQTRVRSGKTKMTITHIALHPSMEQALPMWVGQIRREIDKLEGKILVKPKTIATPADFAMAILADQKEQEQKPY